MVRPAPQFSHPTSKGKPDKAGTIVEYPAAETTLGVVHEKPETLLWFGTDTQPRSVLKEGVCAGLPDDMVSGALAAKNCKKRSTQKKKQTRDREQRPGDADQGNKAETPTRPNPPQDGKSLVAKRVTMRVWHAQTDSDRERRAYGIGKACKTDSANTDKQQK